MADILRGLIAALWATWLFVWLAAAPFVKRARWHEPVWARLLDRVPALLCVLLLIPATNGWWPAPLLLLFRAPGAAAPLAGAVLVAAGLAFALWARLHLGRNWSGHVVVKENHALVRSGPYAIVRHPIYSGLLLALVGTALAIGEWRALLAVAVALIGFLRRIGVEESRMSQTFADYEAYRRTTPALIPRLFRLYSKPRYDKR